MKGRERNSKFFQESTNVQQRKNQNYLRVARETGQINLSNRSLAQCPGDIFNLEDNLEPDEKYWEINPVTKIDLSHNKIPVLPSEVGRLFESLQTLRLRDNTISVLPEELFSCSALRVLDLASNKLSSISSSISSLQFLREIYLFDNNLTSIPDAIVGCSMLQILEMQDNKISSLPECFFFGAIVRLVLSGNKLGRLPNSISEMHSLVFLDVKRNTLISLPDLSNLDKVSFIDASENKLESFPALPEGSSSLDRLLLGNNKLRSIDMMSLMRVRACLSELILNDNSLTEIPYDVGLMTKCKILDFSNNNLSDLPPSIGYIETLQRFLVDGNPIRCIRRSLLTQSTADLKKYLKTRGPPAGTSLAGGGPDGAGAIRGVKSGVAAVAAPGAGAAAGHGASFDPDEQAYSTDNEYDFRIRAMTSGALDLAKIGATGIPLAVVHKLQTSHGFDCATQSLSLILSLNVSENKLTTLPYEVLDQLPALKVLNISSNRLGADSRASAGGPGFRTLPASLRTLDVSKNKITAALLGQIIDGSMLTELYASRNVLESIPPEIGRQTNLRELQLGNNQIKTLALVPLGKLVSLEVLGLSDNSIVDAVPLLLLSSRVTSLALDNNNIGIIPARFACFPSLQHLGLYGNPQKTIRSHLLANTGAILSFLRNRLPSEDLSVGSAAGAATGGQAAGSRATASDRPDPWDSSAASVASAPPPPVASVASAPPPPVVRPAPSARYAKGGAPPAPYMTDEPAPENTHDRYYASEEPRKTAASSRLQQQYRAASGGDGQLLPRPDEYMVAAPSNVTGQRSAIRAGAVGARVGYGGGVGGPAGFDDRYADVGAADDLSAASGQGLMGRVDQQGYRDYERTSDKRGHIDPRSSSAPTASSSSSAACAPYSNGQGSVGYSGDYGGPPRGGYGSSYGSAGHDGGYDPAGYGSGYGPPRVAAAAVGAVGGSGGSGGYSARALVGAQPQSQFQPALVAAAATQPQSVILRGGGGGSVGASELESLKREVAALEAEMELLSISVSKKAQLKRSLAVKRATLLKLTAQQKM